MSRLRGNKRIANISIDSDVLAKARALNLNVSRAAEDKLRELIVEAEREAWLKENREAIEACNRRVGKHGLFGDDGRQF
ncbi:MAG TPA: type II toxin-antitoxin system CcdA family antitoxin [Methyloceanibacter sp.]|nr:type II toxin-antitoxin system CcdA family antitoxin [Methyloceanibacter sp.]